MKQLQIKNYLNTDNSEWQSMFKSDALGLSLVKQNNFAADMLHFSPNDKTCLHTHPGNHILFVVKGKGWLIFDDEKQDLIEGTCYLVPGSIPHQVGTESELYLLSIADNHQPVDSDQRLIEVVKI